MAITAEDIATLPLESLPDWRSKEANVLLADKSLIPMLRDRYSPDKMFCTLTDQVDTLLSGMEKYRCYLSGSRALNFFMPGMCSDDSDWDFYVCVESRNDPAGMDSLKGMSDVLTQIGWKRVGPEDHEVGKAGDQEYMSFVVYRGVLNGHSVQLIADGPGNITSIVLGFHSTIVSCYVGARDAASLYSSLTRDKISVEREPRNTLDRHDAAVKKYVDREVKYMDPKEYTDLWCSRDSDGPVQSLFLRYSRDLQSLERVLGVLMDREDHYVETPVGEDVRPGILSVYGV